MKLHHLALFAAAILGLAACGGSNKVGSGVDLNLKDQVNNQRLGATTTTAAPASTVTTASQRLGVGSQATTTTTTAAPVTTTAKPAVVTTTTAAPAPVAPTVPTLDVAINGDSGGQSQFDPSQARVYSGTLVKWTNRDSVARSIEADDGTFMSPSIPPGESYTYKADQPGKYNYHDGTRPYAVGLLEVLSR